MSLLVSVRGLWWGVGREAFLGEAQERCFLPRPGSVLIIHEEWRSGPLLVPESPTCPLFRDLIALFCETGMVEA